MRPPAVATVRPGIFAPTMRTRHLRFRRGASAVLLLGLVLIAVAAMAGPRTAPPLYDGLCIADPYQYLTPPAGSGQTGKPSGVTKLEDLTQPVAAEVITGESPPQAQVIFPGGALRGKITFAIQPVAPPTTAPPNGAIDGNVYSISARGAAGPVATADSPMSIVLRSPGNESNLVLDTYNNGTWTPLETSNVGCAFQWLANTRRFGEFAVVTPRGSSAVGGTGAASTMARTLGLVVGVLAIVVAVVVLGRAGRNRRN